MTTEQPAPADERSDNRAAGGCVLAIGLAAGGTIAYAVPESAYFVAGLLATRAIDKARTLAARLQRPDEQLTAVEELGTASEAAEAVEEQPAGHALDAILNVARLLGTPHVHLAAIEEFIAAPPGTVRRVLTEGGIPISDVRMQGRGTSTGVKGTDIPPRSSPSPGAAGDVVDAGQAANNSNNNITVTRVSDGAQITVTDLTETRHYAATKEARRG